MFFLKLTFLLVIYLFVRLLPGKKWMLCALVSVGIVQSVVAVLQQCSLVESNHPFFEVTGFFGNPGQMGGFQAVAFVAAWLLLKGLRKQAFRVVAFLSMLVIAYSLVLADSRAALLAAVCGVCVIYWHAIVAFFRRKKWLVVPAVATCACVALAFYLYRSGSADARLLVWRVSAGMVADCPWLGHGPGGFVREYMLYQADYFAEHPDSVFAMVADNAAYPYNEALHVLIEYGAVGLVIVVAIFAVIFRTARNGSSLAPIVALLVFSMFSYPGYKLGLFVLFPITAGIAGKDMKLPVRNMMVPLVILSLSIFFLCYMIVKKQIAERPFILDCYPYAVTEDVIPFLRPTCENWCLIGDYYIECGMYEEAEYYYSTASNMIPSRMLPFYSLWKLYLAHGLEDAAAVVARRIVEQSVKVENTYTLRCRTEVRRWLYEEQCQ